ncbi:MAG: hypothetical protein U0414_28245 [Polyangiaceae bacterium]
MTQTIPRALALLATLTTGLLTATACGGGFEIIYGPAADMKRPIAAAIAFDADQISVASRAVDGCSESAVGAEIRAVERERVRLKLKDLGFPKVADLQPDDYKKIAEALDVDSLIIGRVGGHDDLPMNRYEVTSLEARVVDAKARRDRPRRELQRSELRGRRLPHQQGALRRPAQVQEVAG